MLDFYFVADVFYSSPSSAVQISNPADNWILRPHIGWRFVYFYFLLDRVQHKAIRLTNDPFLTFNLQLLGRRQAVASFCSAELLSSVIPPLTFVRLSCYQTSRHPGQISLKLSHPSIFRSSFFPELQSCETSFLYLFFHPFTICLLKAEPTNWFLCEFSPYNFHLTV